MKCNSIAKVEKYMCDKTISNKCLNWKEVVAYENNSLNDNLVQHKKDTELNPNKKKHLSHTIKSSVWS